MLKIDKSAIHKELFATYIRIRNIKKVENVRDNFEIEDKMLQSLSITMFLLLNINCKDKGVSDEQ